ncbi:MAG: hypothetical protein HY021_07350 [Burkholderiales bacterium]|nr:hypothetical protein [Burkholderiales bacterium]
MWNDLFIDPLAAWIAAALIAALFAHAALAKFADLALLEQHLSAYGVPFRLLRAAARALSVVELLAAVLTLTPLRSLGAGLAALLLVGYGAVMAWHRWHGHALDCGCGGEPLPVSWALVARNAVLAAIAAIAAAPTAGRVMGIPEFSVVVGAVVLATVLYAAFNQILRHPHGSLARHSLEKA